MAVFRGDWLLPISGPPVRGGWVEIAQGRITAVGAEARADARDLGRVAILPSLVNAHTHLELSYLRGSIPSATRFIDWIRAVMAARRDYPDPRDPAITESARRAIADARSCGTGLVGDISNTLVTIPLLEDAHVPGRLFYELLGFNIPDPADRVAVARAELDAACGTCAHVRGSLAAHAPYSVSAGLFDAIRRDLDLHPSDVSTVHVAESPDELQFLERGEGGWKELLIEVGSWTDRWKPPGLSPIAYLANEGFLDQRILAVHAVQCDHVDLARLETAGATVVTCPRSNRHVGVGDPPIAAFYRSGVDVAFGTDSLASVEDLNVFRELAAARRLAPDVPARQLLHSATLTGARALGFGNEYGSIDRGKRASLIAVRLSAAADDVEEYLVGGIEPDDVSWLAE